MKRQKSRTFTIELFASYPKHHTGKKHKQLRRHEVNSTSGKPKVQLFPSRWPQGYPNNEQIVKDCWGTFNTHRKLSVLDVADVGVIFFNILGSDRTVWTASSEFGTYSLCEQRRFRRACASAQSRQNLRCSLIQAVSQEEPSDRKPDPWPL